ncbi:MAG: hypothetical protein VYD64_00630, partial [Pseudomonadota bacterium]|nr:hypothetical protein [Pseudomonadota bacterium]
VETWSYVQIFYDTNGVQDLYTGLYDNGQYWHYDMDQNDEHGWREDNYLFDDSGNLLSHWQIMDDGSTVFV